MGNLFKNLRAMLVLPALLTALTARADVTPEQLLFIETEDGYAVSKAEGATLEGVLAIPDTYEGKPVVEISEKAFESCHGLTAVVLPSGIKGIGTSAFARCDGLREVTFPEGLIRIGSWAFSGCTGLTSVTLPASLKALDPYAFEYCSNLERFDVESGNTAYSSVEGFLCDAGKQKLFYCPNACEGKVVVPEGITEIHGVAFYTCNKVTAVWVPASVKSINKYAFLDCHNLRGIHVDKGNADYCSVRGVLYDKSMQTIICCPSAYSGKFSIPASVTAIMNATFSGCHRLKSIRVAKDNAVFCSVRGILYDKSMQTLYTCPGAYRGSVVVPDGVTKIRFGGFFDCYVGLKSVDLPASVGSVGSRAFWHCKALQRLTCRATVPPRLEREAFDVMFEKDAQYQELPVYVPAASVDAYRADKDWGKFEKILPIEP